MLTSLALIYLVGLSLAAIFGKLKLPRLIGMLLTGILLGPFVLDFFDPQILGISAELRKMALVIILIKGDIRQPSTANASHGISTPIARKSVRSSLKR